MDEWSDSINQSVWMSGQRVLTREYRWVVRQY